MNSHLIYSGTFNVEIFNVDYQGQANYQTYFNLMQELATRHAHLRGFSSQQLQEKKLIWVVTRFECHTFAKAVWGDEIYIETWSRGLIGAHAYRDFLIYKSAGIHSEKSSEKVLLASASSSWITLDQERRIPVVYQDEILEKNSIKDKTVDFTPRKVILSDEITQNMILISEYTVKNSDLDINNHVNNSKYLQWIYDGLSQVEMAQMTHQKFVINYSSECRLGDQVYIYRKNDYFQAKNKSGKIIFSCLFE